LFYDKEKYTIMQVTSVLIFSDKYHTVVKYPTLILRKIGKYAQNSGVSIENHRKI